MSAITALFNDPEARKVIESIVDARVRALTTPMVTPTELRIKHRLTVAQLADASGVSARCINNIEAGRLRRLSPKLLEKLANALEEPSYIGAAVRFSKAGAR